MSNTPWCLVSPGEGNQMKVKPNCLKDRVHLSTVHVRRVSHCDNWGLEDNILSRSLLNSCFMQIIKPDSFDIIFQSFNTFLFFSPRRIDSCINYRIFKDDSCDTGTLQGIDFYFEKTSDAGSRIDVH